MKTHQYERFYGNRTHQLTKVYSVRLSDTDINILKAYYPGESLSYQIRSAINALRHNKGDGQSQG